MHSTALFFNYLSLIDSQSPDFHQIAQGLGEKKDFDFDFKMNNNAYFLNGL